MAEKDMVPENKKNTSNKQSVSIALNTWRLADNSHPILYCTEDTLSWSWKGIEEEERSKASGGILSAFGSIVSLGFLRSDKKRRGESVPIEIFVPQFDRHYQDGGCVNTLFGNGRIVSFRDIDGFYEVSLVNWTLANGSSAAIYSRREGLSTQIVEGCHVARSGERCQLDAAMSIAGGLDMREMLRSKRSMRLWQPMLAQGKSIIWSFPLYYYSITHCLTTWALIGSM